MPPDPAGSPLVGRDAETALLHRLVQEVVAGRGAAVFVEGEPGIGKSTVLAAGLAGAPRLGCKVFSGTCDELGQRLPLQALLACLDGDLGEEPAVGGLLGAVDPVLGGIHRVLGWVDRRCASAPVVLVLDDIQWVDDASLAAWDRMVTKTEQMPLLLVAAGRPVPRRDGLDRLRRRVRTHGGTVLELGPLAPQDVTRLVTDLVTGDPPEELLARSAHAAGNPLYVRELVDTYLRKGAVADAGSLSDAVRDRLDFLSADTREVLRMAALLGAEFSATGLSTMLGRPVTDLLGVLDEATACGVLDASGPLLRFRHGLIRQAFYDGTPMALREALHRQAARVLADAGAPVEQVAQQLLPASELGDAWILTWLTASARDLMFRVPQLAADLLARVLAQAPAGDPRRDLLSAHLATASFLLARHDEVERLARSVLAEPTDRGRVGEMTWILAYTLMRTGRYAEATEAIGPNVERLSPTDAWTARLQALGALVNVMRGDLTAGESGARMALTAAERLGDRRAMGYALHTLSVLHFSRDDAIGVLDAIDRALAVMGEDAATTDLRLVALGNRSIALTRLDRFGEAEQALFVARDLAERTGTARLGMIQTNAAEYYFHVGRWDDALAELDSIDDLPETEYLPMVLHGLAAEIAAHRDDWATADRHLAYVNARLVGAGELTKNAWYLLRARALCAERTGGPEPALAVLAPILDFAMEQRYELLPPLVRAALRAGDEATARAAADACRAEVARGHTAARQAASDVCDGLVTGSVDTLDRAVEAYRRAGRPLELAAAQEDAAVLLAGQRGPDRARAAYAAAVDGYTRLGAAWDLRRADARLRPLGIRRRPVGPRLRAATGWEALSQTEVTVARMVAQGRSNPEIAADLLLSRYTVQTHVSHILAKLGVRGRAEVAREASRHLPESQLPSVFRPTA